MSHSTVIQIIAEHLRANGFDGLVQSDADCGCELDDLAPCSSDFSSCSPAYRHPDPDPDEAAQGGWVMSTSKRAAT